MFYLFFFPFLFFSFLFDCLFVQTNKSGGNVIWGSASDWFTMALPALPMPSQALSHFVTMEIESQSPEPANDTLGPSRFFLSLSALFQFRSRSHISLSFPHPPCPKLFLLPSSSFLTLSTIFLLKSTELVKLL